MENAVLSSQADRQHRQLAEARRETAGQVGGWGAGCLHASGVAVCVCAWCCWVCMLGTWRVYVWGEGCGVCTCGGRGVTCVRVEGISP